MECAPAKTESVLVNFWQCIPTELKIKILRSLPSADKVAYRRVSHEWKALLEDKDIWSSTTRLTLAGTNWSSNQDDSVKVKALGQDKMEAKRIGEGLEAVFRSLKSTAPIRSLEIVDLQFRGGVDPCDLDGLFRIVNSVYNFGTDDLISIAISNIHYCTFDGLECAALDLRDVFERQTKLERLILGPFVCWSDDEDEFNALPPNPDGDDGYVLRGAMDGTMPDLVTLEPLENLRILVLYSCTLEDLRDLRDEGPGALRRLEVFIIYDFNPRNQKKALSFVRKHAPQLRQRPTSDGSLVWTAQETSDVNALVKRDTDSVDFLARFAEFKMSQSNA